MKYVQSFVNILWGTVNILELAWNIFRPFVNISWGTVNIFELAWNIFTYAAWGWSLWFLAFFVDITLIDEWMVFSAYAAWGWFLWFLVFFVDVMKEWLLLILPFNLRCNRQVRSVAFCIWDFGKPKHPLDFSNFLPPISLIILFFCHERTTCKQHEIHQSWSSLMSGGGRGTLNWSNLYVASLANARIARRQRCPSSITTSHLYLTLTTPTSICLLHHIFLIMVQL